MYDCARQQSYLFLHMNLPFAHQATMGQKTHRNVFKDGNTEHFHSQ